MTSNHLSFQSNYAHQRTERTSLRFVREERATASDDENGAPARPPGRANDVEVSMGRRLVQRQEVTSSSTTKELKAKGDDQEGDISHIDQRFSQVISIIEKMFGVKISLADNQDICQGVEGADIEAPPPQGTPAGNADAPANRQREMAMQRYHSVTESESSRVSVQGKLELNDGRKLDVDFNLDMSRMQQEEYWGEVVISGGRKVDPLVVNLNGNAAQLTNQRMDFDLDGDGQTEQVAFATGDSAFLARDKNANGTIDDGGELFGPQSGSGFSDLASHDDNGDGLIDSLDSIWQELKLVQRDEQGNESLLSLGDVGISAFVLERTSSPFGLFNDDGEQTGTIRETGIYVRDDGSVDSVQHVDLLV